MKKLTDLFKEKRRTLSFEFFPPKTPKGMVEMYRTARVFSELGADFFSVTYGAGGATSKSTLEIAKGIQGRFSKPVVHHYTCIKQSPNELKLTLDEMKQSGIQNVLAMRGDRPKDDPFYIPADNELKYGYELVKFIRRHYGDWFTIGVPGFPEGHILTPNKKLDSKYLKVKEDAGVKFVITQFFLDNDLYTEYIDRIRDEGVAMRVIPGILPITDLHKLEILCEAYGVTIPYSIRETFEPIRNDYHATYVKGLEFGIEQCRDLLDRGAPGLHFFSMNRAEPITGILEALKSPAENRSKVRLV